MTDEGLKRMIGRVIALAGLTLPAVVTGAAADTSCAARTILIHSHNDYRQKRPFWDAYEAGAHSIEADIHLVGGDLLVAHDRRAVKPGATLCRLYLDPLRAVMRQNGGRARPDGQPLQLLVDLKSGRPALDRLVEIIDREGYRPCFDRRRNPAAARLTITGDISAVTDLRAYPDYVFFDLPRGRTVTAAERARAPLISHYARVYTRWRSGDFPAADGAKIRAAAAQARAEGARFRLWGFPDHPQAWRLSRELGLDYINTDKPAAVAAFLRGAAAP
jgi:alkaline phosphatase